MIIFGGSTKPLPSPNVFIFYLFVEFFAYLFVSIPIAFSFLEAINKHSGILASYRQAIKILLKNIGYLFSLAFLFALVICLYKFVFLPFIAILNVLSYLNLTGQLSLQSES